MASRWRRASFLEPVRGLVVLVGALTACSRTSPSDAVVPDPGLICRVTRAQRQIPVGAAMMQPICDDVYAEPGLTEAQLTELRGAHQIARGNLARAFGVVKGPASIVLFCHSAACKQAFGAPPANAAAKDLGFARDGVQTASGYVTQPMVVVTGPVAGTHRILTHELVHSEMKAYVPYDSLPTWFNEGVATMVAGEPGCGAHPPSSLFDVTMLGTTQDWEAHIRRPGVTIETYCQARHVVAAWAESYGEPSQISAALRDLLSHVAAGGAFALRYHPRRQVLLPRDK